MKRLIFLMMFLFAASLMSAQNVTVSGVVKDSKDMPVIGAVVMLEGQQNVVGVTDLDGKYSIAVPDPKTARLNVTCMSFKPQTIEVQGRSRIDIVLADDVENLEEVVVVGYGYMRKSDLTGAVSSVKIDESETATSTSIDQMLMGKVSGVNVISSSAAPDAGVDIRIRGASSFNSDNEPLYVIDGVIINGGSETISNLSHGTDNNESNMQTNGLMGINPQDIASIEILKDASATAIYGSEGANGVVLITTKVATRDKPSISVKAGVNVGILNKYMEVLEFDDFMDFIYGRNNTLIAQVSAKVIEL